MDFAWDIFSCQLTLFTKFYWMIGYCLTHQPSMDCGANQSTTSLWAQGQWFKSHAVSTLHKGSQQRSVSYTKQWHSISMTSNWKVWVTHRHTVMIHGEITDHPSTSYHVLRAWSSIKGAKMGTEKCLSLRGGPDSLVQLMKNYCVFSKGLHCVHTLEGALPLQAGFLIKEEVYHLLSRHSLHRIQS